jgi:hypothetical protein
MAEERNEGATTEGPSVTSTVDANARQPRLGTPSDRVSVVVPARPRTCHEPGDKLGKRNRAHVTLIEKARTHFWKPHCT